MKPAHRRPRRKAPVGVRALTLSAVVPATNRPATLPRATAAIARSRMAPEEVLVVDGPTGLSASAARNVGACRATGDVLVFIDADVEVHPDAFARIRAAFRDDPQLTALFGSYDDRPSAPGRVSAFRNLLHHHVHQANAGPAETFWAGLGAVRRDAFLAAGGFDERRFPHPSVEDIDLGVRLAARGGRLRLDPRIQGTHLKRWTLRSMLWTDFARRGIPWVALQLRTKRVSTALNCGWCHRLSAAACVLGVLAGVRRRPLPVACAGAALLAVNRSFYGLLARRRGRADALLGIGLHVLHQLTAAASVAGGVAAHLYDRRSTVGLGEPEPLPSLSVSTSQPGDVSPQLVAVGAEVA